MDSKSETNLNDTILLRRGIEGILNITLADNSQMPNDIDSRRSQHVVIGVRQCLRRRHHNGIAGVNA
jgi:hypothetical protein